MKGNFHVQFLGEGVAATSPPYPTPGWATTQVYPAPRRNADPKEKRQGETRRDLMALELALGLSGENSKIGVRPRAKKLGKGG